MATQRQELSVRNQFSFMPTSLEEAQTYSAIIANSGVCPDSFKGRPNDVFIVLQTGFEMGLKPMQALRTLGVVNGMPFAYGDGFLSLIKRHPDFTDMKEWLEGSIEERNLTAFCTMWRKGEEPKTASFSMEQAKTAGLWSKPVWLKYPARMLQHRARTYCGRDTFPEALYGILEQEEAESMALDEKVIPITVTTGKGVQGLADALGVNTSQEEVTEGMIVDQEEVSDGVYYDATEELALLIIEKNVPPKSVQKWCKQFNVEHAFDIPEEGKLKIIQHLRKPKP